MKLAAELARPQTGRTLYLLDEPTTGLHFDDIKKLLKVLDSLVELGNTVVVIEHNLDVIKTADWVVDLGPEAGRKGAASSRKGRPNTSSPMRRRGGPPACPREKTTAPDRCALTRGNCSRRCWKRGRGGPARCLTRGPPPRSSREMCRSPTWARMPNALGSGRARLAHARSPFPSGTPLPMGRGGAGGGHRHARGGRRLSTDPLGERAVVEVTGKQSALGWFLHAMTGNEWLVSFKFRVPPKTFSENELADALDLKPLNEIDEIPAYSSTERVQVRKGKGPFQEVLVAVHWEREVRTPAFQDFLKRAIAAYHPRRQVRRVQPCRQRGPAAMAQVGPEMALAAQGLRQPSAARMGHGVGGTVRQTDRGSGPQPDRRLLREDADLVRFAESRSSICGAPNEASGFSRDVVDLPFRGGAVGNDRGPGIEPRSRPTRSATKSRD